jgi:glutathione S-transferase
MSLTLHYHPLASFCHKVLIALYENETPFTPYLVDLGDPAERVKFAALWPMALMPVLRDDARGETIPETSIIIEYLDRHYPGAAPLIPTDPDLARKTRLLDRIFDLYVEVPMQKVVVDRLRPEGQHDPFGVAHAMGVLRTAYGVIEQELAGKRWAMGDAFSMADCAAAPALFYADKLIPLANGHPHTAAYFQRLLDRPSFARVLREAEPYFKLIPQ